MQPGKKIARGLLPTFLCLMAMLLVACGGSTPQTASGQKATADKQVLTLPEIGVSDIATFDPALSTDFFSITAIDMVYTGLVQLDDHGQVQPHLAQSYSQGADGLTWTFHLRPNLKFSDGTPLTSQDVVYSIDRALQPSLHSTVAPLYLSLVKDSDKLLSGKITTLINDSLKAPDPNTVVITTSHPGTYFLDALTYSTSYVVEKSLVDKYGKSFTDHLNQGGGDGPFEVQSYTHSQNIVFVPNPNYYGPKPQLSKVIFPFFKEVDTAYQAYQVSQVDLANVPVAHIPTDKSRPDFHQVPALQIDYYTMNYLTKPFDNIKIRQAFALALNKDEIAHNVLKDAVIASNHIVPQGMPGYNPNLKGPDGTSSTKGNPSMAKQLFQQGMQAEGWTSLSQVPPITFTYPSGSADLANEVNAAVQMWQNALGISVKAEAIDFNKLLDDITAATNNAKGLQFWAISWIGDYPDPQDWTTLQFGNGAPDNNINYGQNSTSDSATQVSIQQALVAADTAAAGQARYQAYETAEQQLINDVAWLPIDQSQVTYELKSYVQNYRFNIMELTDPIDWGNIYITAH